MQEAMMPVFSCSSFYFLAMDDGGWRSFLSFSSFLLFSQMMAHRVDRLKSRSLITKSSSSHPYLWASTLNHRKFILLFLLWESSIFFFPFPYSPSSSSDSLLPPPSIQVLVMQLVSRNVPFRDIQRETSNPVCSSSHNFSFYHFFPRLHHLQPHPVTSLYLLSFLSQLSIPYLFRDDRKESSPPLLFPRTSLSCYLCRHLGQIL